MVGRIETRRRNGTTLRASQDRQSGEMKVRLGLGNASFGPTVQLSPPKKNVAVAERPLPSNNLFPKATKLGDRTEGLGAFAGLLRKAAFGVVASLGFGFGQALAAGAPSLDSLDFRGTEAHPDPQPTSTSAPSRLACGATEQERADNIRRQKAELAEHGITEFQRKRAHGFLSDNIYNQIAPYSYHVDVWNQAKAVVFGATPRPIVPHPREDAWSLYLGKPQPYGTIAIAEHTPVDCARVDQEYFRFDNPGQKERLVNWVVRAELGRKRAGEEETQTFFIDEDRFFRPYGFHPEIIGEGRHDAHWAGPLGKFIATLGRDQKGEYVEYTDVWDLDPTINGYTVAMEEIPGIPGEPITFHDRIYFDREKVERVIALEDQVRMKEPFDYTDTVFDLEQLVKVRHPAIPGAIADELAALEVRFRSESGSIGR
jgi:hypothetical protein